MTSVQPFKPPNYCHQDYNVFANRDPPFREPAPFLGVVGLHDPAKSVQMATSLQYRPSSGLVYLKPMSNLFQADPRRDRSFVKAPHLTLAWEQ